MHDQNIIHRDIKPKNIVFKDVEKTQVVIVDMGFATIGEEYKKIFYKCGTPGYVAPEILNDLNYNYKVDVFSCGLILYKLLTGKAAFEGKCRRELMLKNKYGIVDVDSLKKRGVNGWVL